MESPLLFTLLMLLILTFCLYKRFRRMSILQRHGIPTPPPSLVWGNINEYQRLGNLEFSSKLIQKYGPIVGYYLGGNPYVIISDPELLHKILVSDARTFIERPRRIPGGVNPDPRRRRMLAHLPPSEWQGLRKTLTSNFNPTRLKLMLPNITRLVNYFMDSVENQLNNNYNSSSDNDTEIELGSMFEILSLNLIGISAFGRNKIIEYKSEEENKDLLHAVQDKYHKPILSPMNQLSLCFPELSKFISPLRIKWNQYNNSSCSQQQSNYTINKKKVSLWDIAWECMSDSLNSLEPNNYNQFQMLAKKGISSELMVAYAVNAFQGDYENITTSLRFLVHLLAKYPEVQEKTREEYRSITNTMGCSELNVDGDNVDQIFGIYSELKYMEAVVYEMLRLWPQTSMIRRSPIKDYVYKNEESGATYKFHKGVHIQVAHALVQRNPNVWGENSTEFNPNRFYSGEHSDKISPNNANYQGFGSGPRHCMGQKFAMLNLKIVITRLLDKYRLEVGDRSGELGQYDESTMNPNETFYIKLIPL